MDDLVEHFESTRKDVVRADYCLRRFQAAMTFLHDNRESLNFGKAAVVGPEASLISKQVIKTLYRFFAGIPDDHLEDLPTIEQFVAELRIEVGNG